MSRTYLAIWHERGSAVRRSDVLAKDPLRVVVEDGDEVLQVRVLSRSKDLTEFALKSDDDVHRLDFEYLDRRDGGVIEVLHLGARPAKIVGTIPGATIKKPRTVVMSASPRSGKVKPQRWWRPTDVRSRRRLVFLLAGVLSTLYAVIGGMVLLVTTLRTPKLVDEAKYDLSTLDGQDDFATAVARVGSVDGVVTTMLVGLVIGMVLVAVFSWVVFARIGGGVPREILAAETEDQSEESLTEVKRLLESGTEADSEAGVATLDATTMLGSIVLDTLRRSLGNKSD